MKPKLPADGGMESPHAVSTSRRGLLIAGVSSMAAIFSGRMLSRWLQRRHQAQLLVAAAQRVLLPIQEAQLAAAPKRAAEDVHRFFAGICLNVHRFTSLVCSIQFCERLRSCNEESQRRLLLDGAFGTQLVSDVEINKAVQQVIEDTSKLLNAQWASACSELAKTWGELSLGGPGYVLAGSLEQRLNALIAVSIREIRASTYPLSERPSLAETGRSVVQDAIELLPLARFGPRGYLPLFVVVCLAHLWGFIAGQLAHREHEYRSVLSSQLSELSHRIADQCEQTFHRQIAQLHSWQLQAVERLCWQIAAEENPQALKD